MSELELGFPNSSASRDIVVQNIGKGTLSVSAGITANQPALEASSFSADRKFIELEAGTSYQFRYSLVPVAVGLKTATVTLLSNDANRPSATVQLRGVGIP